MKSDRSIFSKNLEYYKFEFSFPRLDFRTGNCIYINRQQMSSLILIGLKAH